MIEVTASSRRKQSHPTRLLETSSDVNSLKKPLPSDTNVASDDIKCDQVSDLLLKQDEDERFMHDQMKPDEDDEEVEDEEEDEDDEMLDSTSHLNRERRLVSTNMREEHVPELLELLKYQLMQSSKVTRVYSSVNHAAAGVDLRHPRPSSRDSSSSASRSPPLATGGMCTGAVRGSNNSDISLNLTQQQVILNRSAGGASESAVSINSTGHPASVTGAAAAATASPATAASLPFSLPGQSVTDASAPLPLGMFSNQFLYSLSIPNASTSPPNGLTIAPPCNLSNSTTCTTGGGVGGGSGSSRSSHPSTTTSGSQSSSSCIFNPDAYCELCNKEFCNKYFLRTHKANKHKIFISDSPPSTGCNPSRSQSPKSPSCPIAGSNSNTSFTVCNAITNSLSPNGATAAAVAAAATSPTSSSLLPVVSSNANQSTPTSLSPIVPTHSGKSSTNYVNTNSNSNSNSNNINSSNEFYSEYTNRKLFCNKFASSKHKQKSQAINEGLLKESKTNNSQLASTSIECHHQHAHVESQTLCVSATATSSSSSSSSASSPSSNNGASAAAAAAAAASFQLSHVHEQKKLTPSSGIESMIYMSGNKQDTNLTNVTSVANFDASMTSSPPITTNMLPSTVVSNGKLTSPPTSNTAAMVSRKNYCHICNKELCNKYFMKTHMLKMHNINIDENPSAAAESSTIGGVTCDICQKELCSKYFLKVHRQNTHGIMDESNINGRDVNGSGGGGGRGRRSTILDQPPNPDPFGLTRMFDNSAPVTGSSGGGGGANASRHNLTASMVGADKNGAYHLNSGKMPRNVPSMNESKDTSSSSSSSSNQHFKHYTEVCALCERRFKSIKWLKTHMANDHADVLPAFLLAELHSPNGLSHLFNNLYRIPKVSTSNLNVKNSPDGDTPRGKGNNLMNNLPVTSSSSVNRKRSLHSPSVHEITAAATAAAGVNLLPPPPPPGPCKKIKSNCDSNSCSSAGNNLFVQHEGDSGLPLIHSHHQFNKAHHSHPSPHEMFSSSSPSSSSASLSSHFSRHLQQNRQIHHNHNNLFNVSFATATTATAAASPVDDNSVKENKGHSGTAKIKENTVSLKSRHKSFKRAADDETPVDDEHSSSHSSDGSSHESHLSSSVKSHDSAENYHRDNLLAFNRKQESKEKNHHRTLLREHDDEDEYDDDDDQQDVGGRHLQEQEEEDEEEEEREENGHRTGDDESCVDLQSKKKTTRVNMNCFKPARETLKREDILSPDISLPYAYGIARDSSFTNNGNKYIIQPFLLSAPVTRGKLNDRRDSTFSARAQNGESDEQMAEREEKVDESFVPSLVYLPVVKKIDEPVTVAFHLTPA